MKTGLLAPDLSIGISVAGSRPANAGGSFSSKPHIGSRPKPQPRTNPNATLARLHPVTRLRHRIEIFIIRVYGGKVPTFSPPGIRAVTWTVALCQHIGIFHKLGGVELEACHLQLFYILFILLPSYLA